MESDPVVDYFTQLDNELKALCPSIGDYEPWNEYNAAVKVLTHTGAVLRSKPDSSEPYSKLPIHTTLGKQITRMFVSGVHFSRRQKGMPSCCSEAEWKLAHSLFDTRANRPDNPHWPIILTIEGKAVAVGKQWGEQTWYGLRDLPERGFFAGVFSAIAHTHRACEQPPNDRAYRYELPANLKPDNIRFSLFATPPHARYNLMTRADPEASIVTHTTHQDIVIQADKLLDTAQRIS